MTTRMMNQTQSQTSSPTADQIVNGLAKGLQRRDGNEGEEIHLTTSDLWYALPSELDHHGSIRGALDRDLNRWQSEAYFNLFECFRAIGLDVRKVTIAEWEQMDVKEADLSEIHDEKMQKLDEAVYFVFEQEKLLFNENPDWIASVLEINNFLTMDSDKIYNQHRELIPFGYSEEQRQGANFDRLYSDLSALIHYITQHYTTRSSKKKIDPPTVIPIYLRIMAEKIQSIHSFWEFCRDTDNSLKHPLIPLIGAVRIEQTHRKITTNTVEMVNVTDVEREEGGKKAGLIGTPYCVSEVNRRHWEPLGSVDAIQVDGEPIVTAISQLPGKFSTRYPKKVYKPKATSGELVPLPTNRQSIEKPVPLIAYEQSDNDLRQSTAPDVAQLLVIAYAVRNPLILTISEGARLLARDLQGELRTPTKADEERFEHVFSCIHGMAVWITDEQNIRRFYPLTACDRFADNRVSIAPAAWARNRGAGRWTLTAGFGVAGQNRLVGQAHTNNIWRVITGCEYWLAREPHRTKGAFKRISQSLIPASGNTGPGIWQKISWQQLMMIAGDIWDTRDENTNKRAKKRFDKIRESLRQAGYETPSLGARSAPSGDTVEFHFGKINRRRGGVIVYFRASARFVEGARKAKRQDWITVNLTEFLDL